MKNDTKIMDFIGIKINTYIRKNIWRFLSIKSFNHILILASIFFLLHEYRVGSPRVDHTNFPGLRDLGTYMQAGNSVLNGQNPYANPVLRIGAWGALPFGVFSFIHNVQFSVLFFQILNLLGVFLSVRYFTNFYKAAFSPVFLLLIWSSGFRELLVNCQITGIILGLTTIGIICLRRNKPLFDLYGAICISLAVDMKPHLVMVLMIVLFIEIKRLRPVLLTLGTSIITHLGIDLYIKQNTTFEWVSRLIGLRNSANDSSLGDTQTFWRILQLNRYVDNGTAIFSTLLVVIFTFLAIYCARQSYFFKSYAYAALVPAYFIYFHSYDLLFISIFGLIVLQKSRHFLLGTLILSLVIIPERIDDLQNIGLVLFLTILFWAPIVNQNRINFSKPVFFGFLLSALLHLINIRFLTPGYIHMVVLSLIIVLFSIIISRFNIHEN